MTAADSDITLFAFPHAWGARIYRTIPFVIPTSAFSQAWRRLSRGVSACTRRCGWRSCDSAWTTVRASWPRPRTRCRFCASVTSAPLGAPGWRSSHCRIVIWMYISIDRSIYLCHHDSIFYSSSSSHSCRRVNAPTVPRSRRSSTSSCTTPCCTFSGRTTTILNTSLASSTATPCRFPLGYVVRTRRRHQIAAQLAAVELADVRVAANAVALCAMRSPSDWLMPPSSLAIAPPRSTAPRWLSRRRAPRAAARHHAARRCLVRTPISLHLSSAFSATTFTRPTCRSRRPSSCSRAPASSLAGRCRFRCRNFVR
jgi:hypothetical protein